MGRFGLRGKLLAASFLVVAVVLAVTAIYVEGVLNEQLSAVGAEAAMSYFRWPLLVGLIIGLALAVGMSALATNLMTREMRQLVQVARELGDRGIDADEPVTEQDANVLAGSFKRLSDELETTMAALASARNRFERVVNALGEGLVACNPEGIVTMANQWAREMLELGDDPVGRPLIECIRVPAMAELLEATEEIEAQFELPGPPRRIFVGVVRPRSKGSRVIVVQDVTAVRRLQTMRRDFVSNVSHELRTPISVIRANAETLADGGLEKPAMAKRFVEAITRNVDRLGGLVEDLLDLNRIETGRQRIELTALDVETAVRQAVSTMAPRAESRETQLDSDVPVGLVCVADGRALDQILVNLIDNAIKYGAEGGKVRVGARRIGDQVRLEVEDDGPGIDPVHRPRVFERFYRVDRGRARHMGGTGLGLAIVKHLVESMNGSLGVEGVKPRGSRFWVQLPVPGLRSDGDAA